MICRPLQERSLGLTVEVVEGLVEQACLFHVTNSNHGLGGRHVYTRHQHSRNGRNGRSYMYACSSHGEDYGSGYESELTDGRIFTTFDESRSQI